VPPTPATPKHITSRCPSSSSKSGLAADALTQGPLLRPAPPVRRLASGPEDGLVPEDPRDLRRARLRPGVARYPGGRVEQVHPEAGRGDLFPEVARPGSESCQRAQRGAVRTPKRVLEASAALRRSEDAADLDALERLARRLPPVGLAPVDVQGGWLQHAPPPAPAEAQYTPLQWATEDHLPRPSGRRGRAHAGRRRCLAGAPVHSPPPGLGTTLPAARLHPAWRSAGPGQYRQGLGRHARLRGTCLWRRQIPPTVAEPGLRGAHGRAICTDPDRPLAIQAALAAAGVALPEVAGLTVISLEEVLAGRIHATTARR